MTYHLKNKSPSFSSLTVTLALRLQTNIGTNETVRFHWLELSFISRVARI